MRKSNALAYLGTLQCQKKSFNALPTVINVTELIVGVTNAVDNIRLDCLSLEYFPSLMFVSVAMIKALNKVYNAQSVRIGS